ncbi:MAG: malonic semialdehyde reductase [Myxococcales bacterium]|nr:malonic semialdehyde reductase [Myxococcales bacterium]
MPALTSDVLAQLFTAARSQNGWTDQPVTDAEIASLWELTRMGPTSANCLPARLIFLRSAESRARLLPLLTEANRPKTSAAPLTVVIGFDLEFFHNLPRLFPHADAAAWFSGNPALARETAVRNGSLQGAYFMLAARALGLDVGPMSGFDAAGVNREFFPGGRVEVNFICNVGHGDPAAIYPRSPRLGFDEACTVI